MRKIIALLFLVIALSVCEVRAEGTDTKTPILTGEIWMKSSADEKTAFIFGIDTVVALEYSLDAKFRERLKERQGENSGRRRHPSHISPFERGWTKALKDMPRKDLIATIDAWYTQHENSLERPVMDLIWFEIIKPRLAEAKAKK